MPFNPRIFLKQVDSLPASAEQERLITACQGYATRTTASQKARCIREMMSLLDYAAADEEVRRDIMEACGRKCIGASILQRASQIRRMAAGIDDLLRRLNEAHIGGGNMYWEGNIIHASYARCYCGSVSQTRLPISGTYCGCSCGWFRELFELLLGQPVEIRLVSSIIQGGDSCQFQIIPGDMEKCIPLTPDGDLP